MRTREDEFARKIQEIMASGQLISDEITNDVLRDRLEQPDAANGVILDGYPRNPAQADWLENYLDSKGEKINAVLLLNLDLYVAFKRAFGRVMTADKSSLYNIFFDAEGIDWKFEEHPTGDYPDRVVGIEKSTGKTLARRPDDANAGSVIRRIETYLAETMPLVEYYRAKGLVAEINAEQSIPAVSGAIKAVLDQAQGS
jgi:adenylate kinase